MTEFKPFPKIARLSRPYVITEKIDGTNASVFIGEDGEFLVGSRTRWITPESDNHGFAAWAYAQKGELLELGPGRHFGEWWGSGIQRGYGLPKGEKRFSLFNVSRWNEAVFRWLQEKKASNGHPADPFVALPGCCSVVPVLLIGENFEGQRSELVMRSLIDDGSRAAPGFMRPEGIVVYHFASNTLFKKTIEKDEEPKGAQS